MSLDGSRPIRQTTDLPQDDSGTQPEQTGTEKNSAIEQRPMREHVFGSNVDKAYFQNKLGTPQGKDGPRLGNDGALLDKDGEPVLLADAGGPKSDANSAAGPKLASYLDDHKQTVQDTKDAKASYEAGRDVLDLTQKARDVTGAKLEQTEKAVGDFKSTLTKTLTASSKELENIQGQARNIARGVADGKIPLGEARKMLAGLQAQQTQVLSKIKSCENLVGQVEKAVRAGGKINEVVSKVSEMGQQLKECKGNMGKALFAVDAACNFADLQARDPNNTEKNVKQAINMSAAKFFADVKTAGTPANMVETAVGVMKFGMWSLGMSDTPAAKGLDAVASGMPIEMFSKNVGLLTDINETIKKDILSGGGALKDWERINNDNLAGNNGPLAQCGAMVGDMMATGGQNLPKKDMYGIGDSLGIYGPGESIPDAFKRANPNAKLRALNELMDSNAGPVTQGAAGENTLKMREMLTYGPPAQTVEVLKQLDKNKLVNNLQGVITPGMLKNNTPTAVTGLVQDLVHKANSPLTPPGVRDALMGQVARIVQAASDNNKTHSIRQLQQLVQNQLGNIPQSLRNIIMNGNTTPQ